MRIRARRHRVSKVVEVLLLLVLMDLMVVLRLMRMVVIPELMLMLMELVVMVTKVRLVVNTEETMIVGLKRQKASITFRWGRLRQSHVEHPNEGQVVSMHIETTNER